MRLSHIAHPKENNATRQLSRCLSRATRYATKHFFHARVSPSFLSHRTFSLRERDMRQASYGTHSYHSDATTISETDAERGRYEEVTVTD